MCDFPAREAAMVVIERDATGKPTVWCDPCIAPLVRALNAGGIRTMASCCGHGRIPATVALADGRWFALLDECPDVRGRTINDAIKTERADA